MTNTASTVIKALFRLMAFAVFGTVIGFLRLPGCATPEETATPVVRHNIKDHLPPFSPALHTAAARKLLVVLMTLG